MTCAYCGLTFKEGQRIAEHDGDKMHGRCVNIVLMYKISRSAYRQRINRVPLASSEEANDAAG